MKGVVTKSTGTWYHVYIYETGVELMARLKGVFRTEGIRDTNPVSVGDIVQLETELGDTVIAAIDERKNYVIRQSPKHKALRHVIASNVDLTVVVVSVNRPRTSTGFIDRFLVSTEAYRIPTCIVINKIDDYREKDMKTCHEWRNTYESIGYNVILSSTITNEGINQLSQLISKKRVLFSGHSGVGKSSLLNAIDETLGLRIGEISKVHEKGMHTTTFSELLFVKKNDSEIIDTPGIKEFGVLHMEEYELKDYFKEFVPYLNQCKFHNCLHTNEPDCAVRNALEENVISHWRYQNYLNILDDIREQSKSWEVKKREWVKR